MLLRERVDAYTRTVVFVCVGGVTGWSSKVCEGGGGRGVRPGAVVGQRAVHGDEVGRDQVELVHAELLLRLGLELARHRHRAPALPVARPHPLQHRCAHAHTHTSH